MIIWEAMIRMPISSWCCVYMGSYGYIWKGPLFEELVDLSELCSNFGRKGEAGRYNHSTHSQKHPRYFKWNSHSAPCLWITECFCRGCFCLAYNQGQASAEHSCINCKLGLSGWNHPFLGNLHSVWNRGWRSWTLTSILGERVSR